jgi:hypothetical protein
MNGASTQHSDECFPFDLTPFQLDRFHKPIGTERPNTRSFQPKPFVVGVVCDNPGNYGQHNPWHAFGKVILPRIVKPGSAPRHAL